MATNKPYKNNVVLWLCFFCLGFSTANAVVSIIIGFLDGGLVYLFATLVILVLILEKLDILVLILEKLEKMQP